jgi:arabinoxylan arabinofuranohydrolase
MKKKTKIAPSLTTPLAAAILFMALTGILFLSCPNDPADNGKDGKDEKELISLAEQPPSEDIAAFFDTDNGFPATLSDARKIWGMNNPSVTFAFVADPSPMVYCSKLKNSGDTENHWCDECTLYVYGSNDTLAFENGVPPSNNFSLVIQGLRVVSTKDLVNWTDHGIINLVGKNSTNPLFNGTTEKVVPYATETWAPSGQWKMVNGKPKFYLYWCNSGNNTTVVVSDVSPIGPFYNPGLTKSMVNKDMDGFETVSWLFDPGTMIDSDGTAYMVLGGDGNTVNPGNVRRVQMNNDMTSIVGNGPELNLPWHFEATDIWKWKNRYYINYTTNWSSGGGFQNIDIAYVMNEDGPLDDFPTQVNTGTTPNKDRANRLLPNGSYGDNTNHASLFDFKGKTYLIYHASSACGAFGAPRLRTAHLVDITVNESTGVLGSINPETGAATATATMGARGVAQAGDFDPYKVTEAETMAIEGGVYTKGKGNEKEASNGISVASIDTGDWLGLYGVDFDIKSTGATKFNAIVKLPVTAADEEYVGAIQIRLDPEQQGISNPTNSTVLTTAANRQSRITGGDVVGYVQLKAKSKEDEGKWALVSANLDETVTGKHNLAFVFYSSTGEALERFNTGPKPDNDGRRRDVGFEIDQWWFE